jgi:hypothetical protein
MMTMMKNLLCATALVAFAGFGMTASANAVPAASVAGISDHTGPAVEQVHFRRHHRYYGRFHWGHRFYGNYGRRGYCYDHPYSWKCKKYGYGYGYGY